MSTLLYIPTSLSHLFHATGAAASMWRGTRAVAARARSSAIRSTEVAAAPLIAARGHALDA
eukprot:6561663-Prymnesium_polylepis.2